MIASSAADLRRYPASAAAYLLDGLPPNAPWGIKSERPHAAGPAQGDDGASGGARPARFLRRRSGAAASPPIFGPPAARCRSKISQPFRAHLREPLAIPYRGGKVFATPELTAGPTLAHTLRLLQQSLQPARGAPGCSRLHRLCRRRCKRPIANACKDMGDADGQARARRRSAGAGLHHAFLGGRPRRQHGGGDADPAVELRLQIRVGRRPASP